MAYEKEGFVANMDVYAKAFKVAQEKIWAWGCTLYIGKFRDISLRYLQWVKQYFRWNIEIIGR